MAQPFDLRTLRTFGEASPVIEGVGSFSGYSLFSASANGVLAYRGQASSGRDTQLTWLDRQGKTVGVVGSPRSYIRLALSPDGTRLASARGEESTNRDIWLTAFSGGSDTRFTFDPAQEDYPVWSPDGSRIAFSSNRAGSSDLYQHSSNGAGGDELLLKSDHVKFPTDWSRDGRFLLYYDIDPNAKRDLWVLPMKSQGPRKPALFLQTPFNEDGGTFSPDGHWIAYDSDESGRSEVYVRPFPTPAGGGGKWMVSQAGGRIPHWRADGKELFYRNEEGDVMAVPVSTSGAALQPGTPKALFRIPIGSAGLSVSADGQKFLVTMPEFESRQVPITIVLNWMSLLKKQ